MENPFRVPGVFCAGYFRQKPQIPQPGQRRAAQAGGVFVQDAGLLLVLVDLDIAGRVFILNKQQGGGQGHRQSSEDGEQCFENLHRFKPPW